MEIRNEIKNPANPFFPNLTALRFIGAFMVFVFHAFSLGREIWGDFTQDAWFKAVAAVTGKGHLGVMLFFVLSGFLITYLMLHENRKKGQISLSNFIARRILRVWPLYFLIIVFGFALFPHLPYGLTTVHELWRYLIFLSNIDEILVGMKDSINFLTATWSVSVEEQFYLSWSLLIAVFGFKKRPSFWIFFSLILVTAIVFRFIYIGNDRMLYFHTFSVISDLAIGGMLALLAFKKKIQPWIEKMARWKILAIYLAGISIILFESWIFTGYLFVFQRIVIASFFAFVIAEQVYANHSLLKLDSIPGLEKSGEFTYGFYMFHCIVIYYCQQVFLENGWTGSVLNFIAYFLVSFVVTYFLSLFSYRFMERPLLQLKRYFR